MIILKRVDQFEGRSLLFASDSIADSMKLVAGFTGDVILIGLFQELEEWVAEGRTVFPMREQISTDIELIITEAIKKYR
ncbi:MAG TPA: hypothetical protein VFQ43_09230 [Nitrososphaera sp.]|nr:MAG: hypothetical protein DMF63_13590 [Acidobacteriota bacterium]HEU0047771.1 hypothetical protein [Nitrososphaera sp.]